MFVQVDCLTTIKNGRHKTFYLFYPPLKTLFPVEVVCETEKSRSMELFTVAKVFLFLNVAPLNVQIDRGNSNNLRFFLNLFHEGELKQMELSANEALEISSTFDLTIFIDEKTLISHGLKVTKDMIAEALYQQG